jgi:GNAT superfamily N-acetyltransferase
MAIRELRDRLDDGLLARFYDELYLPAFAHQREPLEVWRRQLWGEAWPYELSIVVACEGERIDGGIVSELYPASACGFLTYLVVAPAAREAGLGRSLLEGARRALAARARARGLTLRAVFGEVADAARLARFERWGARAVELDYVQPSLGPGLARDPALRLIAFFDGEPPATLPGAVVGDFVRELYAMTDGGGGELALPAEVRLKPAAAGGVHGG